MLQTQYSNIKLKESDKYLFLEISGDIGDATALMPMFKYIFKNQNNYNRKYQMIVKMQKFSKLYIKKQNYFQFKIKLNLN